MEDKESELNVDVMAAKLKYVADYRGAIINIMVQCESLVEHILAFHFVGSDKPKRVEIIHTVFQHRAFELERKRQLLMYILIHNYPDFLTENASLNGLSAEQIKGGFGSFFKRLIDIRNVCGHRRYIPNDVEVNGEFEFELIHFTTESNEISVAKHKRSEQSVRRDIEDCGKLWQALIRLKDLVGVS